MRSHRKIYLVLMISFALLAFAHICYFKADGNFAVMHVQEENREKAYVQMDDFEQFRAARKELRSLAKAQLNDIAHDASTETELKEMARRQLLDLCTREEHELNLENFLNLNGWKDNIVAAGQKTVNVFLRGDSISEGECSAILDYVCRETGIAAGNVKIIPIN